MPKIVFNTQETKEAICLWALHTQGLEIRPEDLQEVTETEGSYEDAVTRQTGWFVERKWVGG